MRRCADQDAPMAPRSSRPLDAYLLRITEVRREWLQLEYELHDLRTGVVLRVSSPTALQRHLRARRDGEMPDTAGEHERRRK